MTSPFVEIRCPRPLPRAGVVCSGDGSRPVGLCPGGSGVLDLRRCSSGVCRLLLFLVWKGEAEVITATARLRGDWVAAGVWGARWLEVFFFSGEIRWLGQLQGNGSMGRFPGRFSGTRIQFPSGGTGLTCGPQSSGVAMVLSALLDSCPVALPCSGGGGVRRRMSGLDDEQVPRDLVVSSFFPGVFCPSLVRQLSLSLQRCCSFPCTRICTCFVRI